MKFYFRRQSREFALQAIYSWQISKNDILEIKKNFFLQHEVNAHSKCEIEYFYELILGVVKHNKYLDNLIKPHLISRKIERIGQIEKAILRISLFELISRYDIPYKVIINEGIELAKSFGDNKSHKFINGLLDNIGFKIRPGKK